MDRREGEAHILYAHVLGREQTYGLDECSDFQNKYHDLVGRTPISYTEIPGLLIY